VLLSAVRAWASTGQWPAPIADPFLARVAAAVAADPGRDWSVEHLASLAAMSRSVFTERFRDAVGRSPAGYVTEVRVREAKRLLDAGSSVSEVSRALGYASDEGFRRAFRRHTGVAPSAWRAGTLTA
ncbi:helix-turn-helix transcriptional regulator, partial [Pseudomonas tremae]